MFITGPDVVKTVTNEEVGKEELGGAQTHSGKSGVTHFMCDNEEETLMSIRELLSFPAFQQYGGCAAGSLQR